jgi:uncharacterized membrane protein YczE
MGGISLLRAWNVAMAAVGATTLDLIILSVALFLLTSPLDQGTLMVAMLMGQAVQVFRATYSNLAALETYNIHMPGRKRPASRTQSPR